MVFLSDITDRFGYQLRHKSLYLKRDILKTLPKDIFLEFVHTAIYIGYVRGDTISAIAIILSLFYV